MNIKTNNNLKCTIALAGLQNVMDPEIGLNIVDLGLIYGIDFDEMENRVSCTMTLTTQFCPMGASITKAAGESLKATFPGYAVHIELTFDPAWNYERISEEGQAFLNER
jgi:metal-sulfur cluster biosynthetic enzyme